MTWAEFVEKAIAVPYIPLGRDYDGWDCYGLLKCAYQDVLGISIPDYAYPVDGYYEMNELLASERQAWHSVSEQVGAAALIYWPGRRIHVGIIAQRGKVLHCERKLGTVQQRVSLLRVEGFYLPSLEA